MKKSKIAADADDPDQAPQSIGIKYDALLSRAKWLGVCHATWALAASWAFWTLPSTYHSPRLTDIGAGVALVVTSPSWFPYVVSWYASKALRVSSTTYSLVIFVVLGTVLTIAVPMLRHQAASRLSHDSLLADIELSLCVTAGLLLAAALSRILLSVRQPHARAS